MARRTSACRCRLGSWAKLSAMSGISRGLQDCCMRSRIRSSSSGGLRARLEEWPRRAGRKGGNSRRRHFYRFQIAESARGPVGKPLRLAEFLQPSRAGRQERYNRPLKRYGRAAADSTPQVAHQIVDKPLEPGNLLLEGLN